MPICCSSLLDPCPQLISFVVLSWAVTSVPALVPVPRRYPWKAGMFYSLLPSELCVSCRYVTGHIWACPPSEGDDYIFHCHPPDQKIPKPKRLQEWYKKMLDKAFAERIIHDYKVRVPGEGAGQLHMSFSVLTWVRVNSHFRRNVKQKLKNFFKHKLRGNFSAVCGDSQTAA